MTTSAENTQVLNLVQAMVGSITPNLRRVTLEVGAPDFVKIRFVLEREDPVDREELEDIVFEFEALQEGNVEVDMDVIVDARPIHEMDLPGRVVFGRKE